MEHKLLKSSAVICALSLSLVACGGSNNAQNSGNTEGSSAVASSSAVEASSSAEPQTPAAVVAKQSDGGRPLAIQVANDEMVSLAFSYLYTDANGNLAIGLEAGNHTGGDLRFSAEPGSFTINGQQVDPVSNDVVPAGGVLNGGALTFTGVSSDDLASVTVSGTLRVEDTNGTVLNQFQIGF